MGDPVTRLFIFAAVAGIFLFLLFYRSLPARVPMPKKSGPPSLKGKPAKPKVREFWTQVYDTDSDEEARFFQEKLIEMGIQCLVYEQGKKDVFGHLLKRYGISVPRPWIERAQSILAQSTP